MLLPEIKPVIKSGNEELTDNGKSIRHTMLDFWKWRMSNVLNNTDRGAFAEFIVAKAIGSKEYVRTDWREFDVATEDGKIKIEVKSASYIQAWKQLNFSTIRFSIRKARLDSETNAYSEIKRHSDLYVFCLLKHKDQETINPLEMEQWEFYVVKTTVLDEKYKNQASISLGDLQKLTMPVSYHKLRNKIFEINKQLI
jgi:hypothetical protein